MNRKDGLFHQDNARQRTSLVTSQKLLILVWEVMLHPQHRPDLESTDYHLFGTLPNSLKDKTFKKDNPVKLNLDQFFFCCLRPEIL